MSVTQQIVLASASPRRQELMKEAGFSFEVILKKVDEDYPDELKEKKLPYS